MWRKVIFLMNDLISVIVPVYKVEKYLRKCVDSICNQSYRNLEIILVDDGSPDSSGSICDEYKQKDERVIVIHKENGGSADARNAALDIMKGDYIVFVDSDDSIEPTMIEKLYRALIDTNSDLAVCNGKYVDENGREINFHKNDGKVMVFDQKQGLRELLDSRKYSNSPWAKLYRADHFDNVRYPLVKILEDVPTIYKLFMKAEQVVYIQETLYDYLYNPGSVTHQDFNPERMVGAHFAEEMVTEILKVYPDLKRYADRRLFDSYYAILTMINKDNEFYPELKAKYDSLRWKIVFGVHTGIKRKIKALRY